MQQTATKLSTKRCRPLEYRPALHVEAGQTIPGWLLCNAPCNSSETLKPVVNNVLLVSRTGVSITLPHACLIT